MASIINYNTLDYLSSKEILEPHCPKCDSKVDYGITTTYNEKEDAHVCNSCGHVFK